MCKYQTTTIMKYLCFLTGIAIMLFFSSSSFAQKTHLTAKKQSAINTSSKFSGKTMSLKSSSISMDGLSIGSDNNTGNRGGCPTVGYWRYSDQASLASISPVTCADGFWLQAWDSVTAGGNVSPGWKKILMTLFFLKI